MSRYLGLTRMAREPHEQSPRTWRFLAGAAIFAAVAALVVELIAFGPLWH